MKTLFLARHAKSDWNQAGYSDFDRPLNSRGEIDAPVMASFLQKNYSIDLITSSDAARALATATEYQKILTPDKNINQQHSLYNAAYFDINDVVKQLSDSYSAAMIVGHNPGMSDLVNFYCKNTIDDMPTCSVAVIQFAVSSWNEIQKATGELLAFEFPKKRR